MKHEIHIICAECGIEYDARVHWLVCPRCGHETEQNQILKNAKIL